jgi:epoxyqueuosine reductase
VGVVAASVIAGRCERLGFALCGVCGVEESARATEYDAWIAAGKHGSMEYLARNAEVRKRPELLLPGARSVIVVGDLYRAREVVGGESGGGLAEVQSASQPTPLPTPLPPPSGRGSGLAVVSGRIARYAQGRDYHKVMKKRLHELCDALAAEHPGAGFRAFVDTAPVMERELALRAGLGWIGKHTLLIHPRLGSSMLLGGVMTTLEISDAAAKVEPDHCGTCTRCIDACPTQAITPYSVDASRCISYLTIERRGEIDESLQAQMGEWIFGCDVCQEVCPHNSVRPAGSDVGVAHGAYAPAREMLDAIAVLRWTEEDRRRELAGTAMTRAKLEMLKRNALIVVGNAAVDVETRRAVRAAVSGVIEDVATSAELVALARRVLASLS